MLTHESKVYSLNPEKTLKEITEQIKHAAQLFKDGEKSIRQGAEIITALHRTGMSMNDIAVGIGRSKTWVHTTITWCQNEFKGNTPFGPSSKVAREKKKAQVANSPRARSNAKNGPSPIEPDDEDEDNDEDDVLEISQASSDTKRSVIVCRWLTKVRRRLLIESLENLSAKSERTRLGAADNAVRYLAATQSSWHELLIPASDDHES